MTDLPKLTSSEYQEAVDVINTAAANATAVQVKRSHKAKRRPSCGCNCEGCIDPMSNSRHCLETPCTQKRNRRTPAELTDAERFPGGRLKDRSDYKGGARRPNWHPPRTPEQIEAAGRYPSGRPKPDRSGWSYKPAPAQPDPLAARAQWFVHAHRNGTTVTLPVYTQDEAETVAERLAGHGWDGGELGEVPMIRGGEL